MPACHPARRFARIRASGTGNHRPVVYTTGLRMPMPSTRLAQRRPQAGSGPGAPPSCVRRTGRPTDGGTVRTMEGKDHERQRQGKRGDHRQVRGVRRRDARAGHASMRGMPRHAVRELRRNMPRLRRRPVPRMLRGMPMRGNPLPRLRAPLQRVRENAAVLRLRSPLRRLRRPALLRLRIQVRGLRLRALLRMRVRPRRRLRLLLRLLEQQTAGTLLRRQPVLAQNAGTQAHAHHRARNRNQRRARPEPTQGKPAHRGLVHRFEPRRRGTRIPDANPHPRGLRRHLRTRARNPHRIKGTRQGWRAHAPAPHEPPDPQPLVLGAQGTVRPAGTQPQHAPHLQQPMVRANPRRLRRQAHRRQRMSREHHRAAHLRPMGRDHRPQTHTSPRMGEPHVAPFREPRPLPAQNRRHHARKRAKRLPARRPDHTTTGGRRNATRTIHPLPPERKNTSEPRQESHRLPRTPTSATPGTRPDSAPRRRGRRMGRAGTSAGPRLATAAATRPVGRSDPPHPKNRRTTDGKTTRRPRPRTRDDHTSRDDAAESSASSVGSAPSGAEAAAGRGSNDAIGEGST